MIDSTHDAGRIGKGAEFTVDSISHGGGGVRRGHRDVHDARRRINFLEAPMSFERVAVPSWLVVAALVLDWPDRPRAEPGSGSCSV